VAGKPQTLSLIKWHVDQQREPNRTGTC